jgi:hypothetical protein
MTDMSTISIADQGLRFERFGPPDVLDGVAERRAAVLRAIEVLAPVVRPLAVEISFGPLDPDTFRVARIEETRRIAVRDLPDGVVDASDFADPPEPLLVDELTADVLTQALTPPQPDWDIAKVRASVTAARITATDLTIEQLPSRPVPEIEFDGDRWVVGPLDAQGLRLLPPIALTWRQEYGDVVLFVEAFWSPWWRTDTPEHAGLRAVEQALTAAGFPETAD